ncbi:tetratricopeptide repeat protein [Hymenobacter sp. 15J16-1T3B]|uniref:tetratricopeptide repeat protein n=1 Tax=Hymenobacter sp. 15J16-1T3B TaxID=2886941 RepID=UPI001D12BC6E|nr:tetratricopeptide repeat protein [Hymenobacter sp. 15J16-1T3B]MCC3158586.1 tetratricopeptide repeat protein [Hymenobacter sp. 15J16-1T3B]
MRSLINTSALAAGLAVALLLGARPLLRAGQYWLQFGRGQRAYYAEAPGDAEVAYRAALRAAPGSPAISFNLANALYQQGRYAEAIRLYRQLLATGPAAQRPQVWANLGNAYYQLHDLQRSEAAYRQALLSARTDARIRQDFLLVHHQAAAAARPTPPPQAPSADRRRAEPEQNASSKSPQTTGQDGASEEMALSHEQMRGLLGMVADNESAVRAKTLAKKQREVRAVSDEKAY